MAFNIHVADFGNTGTIPTVFAQPSEGIQILVRNYPAWAWIATHFWNLWDAPVDRGAKPCTISPTVLDLVKNEIIDLLVRMFVLPSVDPDGVDGDSVDASDPNASNLRLFNLGELKQRWQNHEYEEVGRREIALLNARGGKDGSLFSSPPPIPWFLELLSFLVEDARCTILAALPRPHGSVSPPFLAGFRHQNNA